MPGGTDLGCPGWSLSRQRRGQRVGKGRESGVLAVTTATDRQHQYAGRCLEAFHSALHPVQKLRGGPLALPLWSQGPVFPARAAQQGCLWLLLLHGPGSGSPTSPKEEKGLKSPSGCCSPKEAPTATAASRDASPPSSNTTTGSQGEQRPEPAAPEPCFGALMPQQIYLEGRHP